MKKIGFILVFLLALFMPIVPTMRASAQADSELAKGAKAALLLDSKSGTIVYEKNADKKLPIASMTKLASLMLIFDSIEKGELNEETLVKVSEHAADTDGSSAFLDEKSEYKVGDLIMTVIVCSANDSTVALAEKVAGSESEFVMKMNSKVREMGLENTSFMNATGLPAVDHYSTAKDIAKIYAAIADNKIYKKYSKIWMTELKHPSGRKTDIVNTNRLIKTFEGCDSGKTGFTNDAGYCLAASATRGGMRLVGVVMGESDSKTRFNEMADMFNYGFNNFENKVVISSAQPVCEMSVKQSKEGSVKVYPSRDYVKFLKKGENFEYNLSVRAGEGKAPIKSGTEVGTLYVLNSNNVVIEQIPLCVKQDIEKIKIGEILVKIFKKI